MAPYKNDCGEKTWATVQDKKMQFIKWLLLKNGAKQLEKTASYKNVCGKKNWATQCKINKCNLKNRCCQKTGAKQLKKIAPYKNDYGQQKSEPNSVG